MSAIRSASSSAVTVTSERSQVRWSVWSVSRPGVAISRSTPRLSSAACRLNDIPPTTEVTVRPIALANGASASTTCWASSRVGTSTSPRGLRGRARPPSSRASMASPKASVLPEPVWPRPSRSRPASVSGRVAAWIGNGSVKPPAVSAVTIGVGSPSWAKLGMPASGTVHSTSGGATTTGEPGRASRAAGSTAAGAGTTAAGTAGSGARRERGTTGRRRG